MTSISELLEFFIYGIVRYIVYWIPLITPPAVERPAPWQWFRYNWWDDWFHRNDNRGGPDEVWLQAWFRMIFGEAIALAVDSARPYVDRVNDALRAAIGAVASSFGSLSDWINRVQSWLGLPFPWWAGTITSGLRWLRGKLPASIREGWRTWDAIFESIRSYARDWVMARYEQAKQWARTAFDWAVNAGQSLINWRDRVAGWIDAFIANPYGTITTWLGWQWNWLIGFIGNARSYVLAWLGPDINKLLLFAQDAVTFYYNLWSRGWRALSELVDNPAGWLYDLIERALVDRW